MLVMMMMNGCVIMLMLCKQTERERERAGTRSIEEGIVHHLHVPTFISIWALRWVELSLRQCQNDTMEWKLCEMYPDVGSLFLCVFQQTHQIDKYRKWHYIKSLQSAARHDICWRVERFAHDDELDRAQACVCGADGAPLKCHQLSSTIESAWVCSGWRHFCQGGEGSGSSRKRWQKCSYRPQKS